MWVGARGSPVSCSWHHSQRGAVGPWTPEGVTQCWGHTVLGPPFLVQVQACPGHTQAWNLGLRLPVQTSFLQASERAEEACARLRCPWVPCSQGRLAGGGECCIVSEGWKLGLGASVW